MQEESTTSLLNILNQTSKNDIPSYIKEYGSDTPNTHIFSEYIAEQNGTISAAQIIRNCADYISRSYANEVLNGTKTNVSRDVILMLCIGAHMNRKMTRRVLANYGHRDLYPKNTRDIIIATYINNKEFDLLRINDELNQYQLPILATEDKKKENQ